MRKLPCFILLLATLFTNNALSQKASKEKNNPADCKLFFTSEEPIEMVLTSDFKKIRSQKKKGVYQSAYAVLRFNDKDSLADSIRIAARGEMRRQVCSVPSLMVDFKGKKSSPLSRMKKMKLVCGCAAGSTNEALLLSEYLVYKIYNLLTNFSFRTRLVKTTYQDIGNKLKPYSQYAFLIEDVDELAARNNCREYEKPSKSMQTDLNQATLLNIFQYMIGNTDWSVPNFHNIKLLQSLKDTFSVPYMVPYDFDFSGFVNAPYAFPNQELFAIERVTDRYYRGFPRSEDEVEFVLDNFRRNKEKIMALVRDFELVKMVEREKMIQYLQGFYQSIDNKRFVRYHFVEGIGQ